MEKRRQKKSDSRAEFEAFLSRTAIGREYLEDVEETVNDLRANTDRSSLSKERLAVSGGKEVAQVSTKSDTSTTS